MRDKLFMLACILCLFFAGLAMLVTPPSAKAATEEEIEAAIVAGVEWLVGQQSAVNGSWQDSAAKTGLAVVKLEDRAFELGYDGPFDPEYPYHQNVIDGLNYIFSRAATDSCGTHFESSDTYDTGIAMMAIANSGDMSRLVTVGPLTGSTYGDVLAANVSYFGNVQSTSPAYEGGFGYACGGGGDQSNSGYAVLGLQYAQAAGVSIPQGIKDQLSIWIDIVQCPDGGSKYSPAWDFVDPCFWENSLKTGNLLAELAFVGDLEDSPRTLAALGYIATHWYDNDWIDGWGYNLPVAQYQAAYTLMKGLESMGIPDDGITGVLNWFQDLASAIVAQQTTDGYWPNSPAYVWPEGYGDPLYAGELLSTLWALLTLERVAPPPPFIEVPFDIKPGSCPNPLNVKSKGVLPAAIMGTADFDVTTIDPESLQLCYDGNGSCVYPLRWAYADVGAPFEPFIGKEDCFLDCESCSCADELMDLVFHFDTQEVVITLGLGELSDEACEVLEIRGALKEEYNGTPIIGEDVLRILKKGK